MRDEKIALAYSISKTEFEIFFQGLFNDILHNLEEKNSSIKSKKTKTCQNYCNVRVPYRYKQ